MRARLIARSVNGVIYSGEEQGCTRVREAIGVRAHGNVDLTSGAGHEMSMS